MLSVAAFLEDATPRHSPVSARKRTGAPVVAYCRLDDREIRLREPILQPDAILIQDPTLLNQVDVFGGLSATATSSSTPRAASAPWGSRSS